MSLPAARTVYAVSELADLLRNLIEDALPRVWVEAEISNFSRPASGHWYFTLKDEKAQLRCAMFRGANHLVRPVPSNGDRVLVRASVGFYAARGDLQLICEHLEPAGEGALLRAFEALKRKLAAEGLFEAARKRALPPMPRRIGLITSATGAAIQDVLSALGRRFPLASVSLWPVPVQGEAAAPAIARALREMPARSDVDLILLVRGGGSLEDLWAFNEEAVARAIHDCAVPVVSGVGHETDTTISDFVADLRAPTPTAAAELATPDRRDLSRRVLQLHDLLQRAAQRGQRQRADRLDQGLRQLARLHPKRAIQERAQRLDESSLRLAASARRQLLVLRRRSEALTTRLAAVHPARPLARRHEQLSQLDARLQRAMRSRLHTLGQSLAGQASLLRSLSPEGILERGYAIARLESGRVVRDAAEVVPGTAFELRLARGELRARREP